MTDDVDKALKERVANTADVEAAKIVLRARIDALSMELRVLVSVNLMLAGLILGALMLLLT